MEFLKNRRAREGPKGPTSAGGEGPDMPGLIDSFM
jgi:hypothetical protein